MNQAYNGAVGGGGTREIDAASAHSDADTVYFGLGGSNGGNHSGVYDFATMEDGGFFYKEADVGAVGHTQPPAS